VTLYSLYLTTPDAPWPLAFTEELPDDATAQSRAQELLGQLRHVYGRTEAVAVDVQRSGDGGPPSPAGR
jgi:hypothetical protein